MNSSNVRYQREDLLRGLSPAVPVCRKLVPGFFPVSQIRQEVLD